MSPGSNSAGANPFGLQFSPEEEEEFGEMARSEGFYERFAKSVAPSIYGSLGTWIFMLSVALRSLHVGAI
jgi:DNA replication licensing factor MCM5